MFDFLVIIDFEATCDEGANPVVTRENQEIIEFPWVVLDAHTTQILDKRQLFVKPEWTNGLTQFCKNLTGITNEQLASAGSLKDAIQQFDNYVYTGFVAANKTFCIVTDGSWDLKYCLRQEAAAKGITLAAHYSTFFDLRAEFQKFYNVVPQGLRAMLDYLNLVMEGRHHSGIDDCLNISKIVTRLISDGHQFTTPEVIPDNFVPEATYKDFSKPRFEQQGTQEAGGTETVLRLRGLPWQATEDDIINFFAPLNIAPGGIHLTLNNQGRPSGEAFVEFATEAEAHKGLEKNRQTIGTRYVEIFKVNRSEMDHVLNPHGHGDSGAGGVDPSTLDMHYQGVLRMRGLPYSASVQDIHHFFQGYDIANDGVHIQTGMDGRPNGDAYVEFATEAFAEAALGQKNKEKIGTRYIELFRSTRGEMYNSQAPRFGMPSPG